jgi:hypothetical protein
MKRVNLGDEYVGKVEEGIQARVEKVTKRVTDPVQVQAISNFATKIRDSINQHRDNIPTHPTPITPNSKKYDEELSSKVDATAELLSAIVTRVRKHRNEIPQLVTSFKLPPRKYAPTNEPAKTDNIQIDGILCQPTTRLIFFNIQLLCHALFFIHLP